MDAATLDGTIAELRPLVVGRYLSKPRLAGGSAVAFDVQGSRDRWLWLDAGRGTAGVYWLPRDTARSLVDRSPAAVPGRSRQALLHLRKHLDGARVVAVSRVAGERAIVLEAGDSRLALRLGGSAPALSLVRDGAVLGSLGVGPEAWPVPEAPEREWDRIDPVAFEAAVAAARAEGRSLVRAILAACPGLGPQLAREMDGSAVSLAALRERLRDAAPCLLVPLGPGGRYVARRRPRRPGRGHPRPGRPRGRRADRAARPRPGSRRGRSFSRPAAAVSSSSAAGALPSTRPAGRSGASSSWRRTSRRTSQASPTRGTCGSGRGPARLRPWDGSRARVRRATGPRRSGGVLVVALDPRLGGLANAERLFDKARRVERARHQIDLRLRETRSALLSAREGEALVLDARDTRELPGRADEPGRGDGGDTGAGPRHYLTGRGLSCSSAATRARTTT